MNNSRSNGICKANVPCELTQLARLADSRDKLGRHMYVLCSEDSPQIRTARIGWEGYDDLGNITDQNFGRVRWLTRCC